MCAATYFARGVRWFCFCAVGVLLGCGGGGGSTVLPTSPPLVAEEEPKQSDCDNELYAFISASDDESSTSVYDASKAIDGDFSSVSRWQSSATNNEITLDMGREVQISALTVKWFRGSELRVYFDVEVSGNAQEWTPVITGGESSGKHSGFELHSFDTVNAGILKYGSMAVLPWRSLA